MGVAVTAEANKQPLSASAATTVATPPPPPLVITAATIATTTVTAVATTPSASTATAAAHAEVESDEQLFHALSSCRVSAIAASATIDDVCDVTGLPTNALERGRVVLVS